MCRLVRQGRRRPTMRPPRIRSVRGSNMTAIGKKRETVTATCRWRSRRCLEAPVGSKLILRSVNGGGSPEPSGAGASAPLALSALGRPAAAALVHRHAGRDHRAPGCPRGGHGVIQRMRSVRLRAGARFATGMWANDTAMALGRLLEAAKGLSLGAMRLRGTAASGCACYSATRQRPRPARRQRPGGMTA